MAYEAVMFDSTREYEHIIKLSQEIYNTEKEASECVREKATQFVERIKKEGHLIDINRLSVNSIRIDYLDVHGKESFAIFQVFEIKNNEVNDGKGNGGTYETK